MSEIQRITLISDPTNEFPNNTNNSFKVRLPERTTLAGDRWHASLLSLSVPDHGQSNGVIASDPHTQVIRFNVTYTTRKYVIDRYHRVSFKTDYYIIELEDIMNANQSVTSGSRFWKRVMQEVHKKVMTKLVNEQENALTFDADERPVVSVKKNWMPTLSWKDDALILHAIPKGELMNLAKTKALTDFSINLGVAEKFGLVEQPKGWSGYRLGPNLQFTLPTTLYNTRTPPSDPSNRAVNDWMGEHYVGQQPSDLTSDVMDQLFMVKNKRLYLSLLVEWQFNNMDAAFEKIVGTTRRTVMVYSDVVQSTVVGSGKFPLLREVQLTRTGDGRSMVEPLHQQWIKVRGNQLDILEVEVSNPGGSLTVLPPGKTIVTIGLKQL